MPVVNSSTPEPKQTKNSSRIFNASPLNLNGVGVKSMEQKSYNRLVIECDGSATCVMNRLANSNPLLNFGIIGDPNYDDERSKLIRKPDEPVWLITEDSAGKYSIQLSA